MSEDFEEFERTGWRERSATDVGATQAAVPDGPPSVGYSTSGSLGALLSGAGLIDVRVDRVGWTHRVAPGRWWDDLLGGMQPLLVL